VISENLGEQPQAPAPSCSPAVVNTLSPESEQTAACGALGCRERPEFVVRHPDYGERSVCLSHAQSLLRRPPAKARERPTAAHRNVEVGKARRSRAGSGGQGVNAQRPEGASRGAYGATSEAPSRLVSRTSQPAGRVQP